jgi:hypothetical protein
MVSGLETNSECLCSHYSRSSIAYGASAHRFTVRNLTVNNANTGRVYDVCWYTGLISFAPKLYSELGTGVISDLLL